MMETLLSEKGLGMFLKTPPDSEVVWTLFLKPPLTININFVFIISELMRCITQRVTQKSNYADDNGHDDDDGGPCLSVIWQPLQAGVKHKCSSILTLRMRQYFSVQKWSCFISSVWILTQYLFCFYVNFLLSTVVCASSCVSSKNLGQSRQCHIGCICLAFHHCAFSNVSSNGLPEKR